MRRLMNDQVTSTNKKELQAINRYISALAIGTSWRINSAIQDRGTPTPSATQKSISGIEILTKIKHFAVNKVNHDSGNCVSVESSLVITKLTRTERYEECARKPDTCLGSAAQNTPSFFICTFMESGSPCSHRFMFEASCGVVPIGYSVVRLNIDKSDSGLITRKKVLTDTKPNCVNE
ncbi:hypothetical protein ACJMK2_043828 [Sinanodonta woodiana]|uniref:Uncharacterized protein n=1 Tax=Sinanodonta woodiana TaxID=1069815 RepID=A0ABD3VYM2_SINWO